MHPQEADIDHKDLTRKHFPDLIEMRLIRFDEPMSLHTSFEIGGPADVWFTPNTQAQLIKILVFALEFDVPYAVIGKGSNLLVSDCGIRGIAISTSLLNKITRDEIFVSAFCGTELKALCDFTAEEGLAGLEFASGIPGSVGGAVFMNAGAYNGEIKDLLYCSKCLSPTLASLTSANAVIHLKAEKHDFSYRYSALQRHGYIHLSSVFRLMDDDPASIKARMQDLHDQRWDKQPMDLPSGGSVFKRPDGFYTGKLVDDCGLRGFQIGAAAVSNKHCGFIVNLGGASAADVLALIRHVQNTVFNRFGVRLETEIRMLGEM